MILTAPNTTPLIPTFVLDVSVLAAWAIPSRYTVYTHRVQSQLAHGSTAIVTTNWIVDLLDELLLAEARSETSQARADTLISSLAAYRIVIDTQNASARWVEVITMARSLGILAREAMSLDLAQRLTLPLSTVNQDLLRAAANAGVAIYQP